jgi:hypothetical protein
MNYVCFTVSVHSGFCTMQLIKKKSGRFRTAWSQDNFSRQTPAFSWVRKIQEGIFQIARNKRAGRKSNAETSSSAPSTAIPTIRNGSRSSQTMGYSMSANRANGQHRMKSRHQSRSFTIDILRHPAFTQIQAIKFRHEKVHARQQIFPYATS